MFRGLVAVVRTLLEEGHKVVVACNDPIDLPIAESLFEGWLPGVVVCPETPGEYFQLLSTSRAVVSGRLHTAVVAFSLGTISFSWTSTNEPMDLSKLISLNVGQLSRHCPALKRVSGNLPTKC